MSEIIIKKGTLITIHGCCNLAGSDQEFEETMVTEDTPLDELNQYAYETAADHFQVEGWIEVKELPPVGGLAFPLAY